MYKERIALYKKLEDKLILQSDYTFVNSELEREQKRSLEYLKENL